MKPESQLLEVDDTTNGTDVVMGIDAESIGHIMDMLTGVYEDPELAPGRELATNALDSHIASGQTRPIEVEVGRQGSQLSLPVLRIQDWGLGMDLEDIRRIFSQYGASTKRGGNEEVGMFGIGGKSPLAYTDQFTVEAVKDGHKIIVSISREEEGGGVMTVMDAGATDEPNGVKAEVPVHTGNDMLGKLEHFFSFWERGTVLLNGEEPEPVWERESAVQITDSICVLDTEDLIDATGTDYVVMGNVPYPTDLDLYERSRYGGSRNKTVVATVGIGGVSIPPARESLKDTKGTKDTLARIKREFINASALVVQANVDAAPNHGEALQAYVKSNEALPSKCRPNPASITYKGDPLPEWGEVFGARQLGSAGYKHSTGNYKPELARVAEGIWITEYPNENFTGSQRAKLILFLESKGWVEPSKRSLFLLRSAAIQHDKWVPASQRFKWEEIKKWKVPGGTVAAGYGTKVITGSYFAHLSQNHPDAHSYSMVQEVAADALPKQSVYYRQCGKHDGKGWYQAVQKYDSDATLVLVPKNRLEKFKRDFPKVLEVREAIRKKVEAKLGNVKGDTQFALHMDRQIAEDYHELRALKDRVPDPDLKRTLELAELRESLNGELSAIEEEQRKWGVAVPDAQDPAIDTANERYPLLRYLYHYSRDLPMDEVLTYINAAYAARKEAS